MHSVMKKQMRKLLSFAAVLLSLFLSSQGFAATEITNIRHWAAPDHTRVVFDLSADPDYRFKISDNMLILNFSGTSLHPSLPAEKVIDKPGINKILFQSAGRDKCVITIVLGPHIKTEVFKLKKFMDKPDRVVVDIIVGQATLREEIPQEPVRVPSAKKRVIVIDPGHGGEDPGAIGQNGTYEKHVVLAISREIKKTIDRMPGYRAVLTRDGDYYVSFSRRLNVARKTNASLFISVHADAARNRQARGSSVYCLSTGAASNEAAKLLANNENLSDIIGGVPDGEGNNQSDEIILNMFQTNTINLSKTYASYLLDQLGRVHCLKYTNFHEAPFRVLKLLDIPAVLLETAFLSHDEEERLLKTGKFRKTIASAVALSVNEYFSSASPAVLTADAGKTQDQSPEPGLKKTTEAKRPVGKTITYRVKPGDNLNVIARKHETTLAALLKLNDIKIGKPLYVGRKILIEAGATEPAAGKPLKKYTVKKGDTMFSLAKSCSITIEELRRINNMSESDSLLLGQKIKLPQ
jgi:N-acetylmuramoyl-L-alanine amidase